MAAQDNRFVWRSVTVLGMNEEDAAVEEYERATGCLSGRGRGIRSMAENI